MRCLRVRLTTTSVLIVATVNLSLFLQAQVHEAKEVATLVGVDAYVKSRFESRSLHTQSFACIWHIELR